MTIDFDVPEGQRRPRSRYNFDQVRPGASMHVATNEDRCRVMAAFKYWSKQRPERRGAYAISAKVGHEDPRGPGFRVWFKSKKADASRTAAMTDTGIAQPQGDI